MLCSSCPRECGVDRSRERGYCLSGEKFRVARAALHRWEEPCISACGGSGTVFFCGCNLRCVFCQNAEISSGDAGVELDDDALTAAFDRLLACGARNLNLVAPTHYADALARVLRKYHSPVPVVYNCGGYESVETLKKLEGLVDIYLPDFKYADNPLAARLSNAPDYFERAASAILEMQRQVGTLDIDCDGTAKRGLLIRHLILPGAVGNTKRVLRWIHDNLPEGTSVSLMSQYTPAHKAINMPELGRRISKYEYSIALNEMLELGFENGYIQGRSSAEAGFVPDFKSLEGL